MTVFLRAPHPTIKTTTILPNPKFLDSRRTQSSVQIKRTPTRVISHPKTSDKYTLVLPFQLTRMKGLELEAFANAYQTVDWHVTLHDGSEWAARLVGPFVQTPVTRQSDRTETGKEAVDITLTLSATRLN